MNRHAFAVGLSLVAVLAGCGGDSSGESQSPASTATVSNPTPSSVPAGDAPIEPGMYRVPRSAWSVADFTVTFPDGWEVQQAHLYNSNRDQDDEFGFYAVVVDEIFADPCAGSNGDVVPLGPSVTDLADALLQQPGPIATDPVQTTFGGYPATRIDLSIPDNFDLEPCNAKDIGLQIWYSQPADKNLLLVADGSASVYILDVVGERQVFVTQQGWTTSGEDLAELQAVLDSIRIES